MKKLAVISIVIASGYFIWSCKEKKQPAAASIAQYILRELDSFTVANNDLLNAVTHANVTEKNRQHLFLQLRLSYKKIEWAVEYFTPLNARLINGAPVQEAERSGIVSDPAGLQVMEPMLFPNYDSSKRARLIEQLTQMRSTIDKVKLYFENIDLLDWQIFDAAKMEVFRIETLGITGFDDPLTLQCMRESAAALQSIEPVMDYYNQHREASPLPLLDKMNACVSCLLHNKDFNSFNRAEFITHYADPVSISITKLEKYLNIHEIVYKRLLRQDALTLSDTNAFDPFAYTPDMRDALSDARIELGKRLFVEPALSANGKRSCQTCHQPDRSFTDGLAKNSSINGDTPLHRNTPTLINAALQPSLFFDERATTLEEQANDVIHNKNEMHGSLNSAIKKLKHDKDYQQLFSNAFPEQKGEIDSVEILIALGDYIRSLVMLNSRFDDYMRGHTAALTLQEREGFNLFMGKAKCATCHYFPLFNGTLPPRYTRSEAEVIGVPVNKYGARPDTDRGVYNVMRFDFLMNAFKTPTVRNAGVTPPYMHNGVFTSLKEVIDFYNKGGGRGLGFPLSNQTLPENNLHLSDTEKAALVSFIESLNSRYPAKNN